MASPTPATPPSNPSSSLPPFIHMATVSAPTNIACVKYWGKSSIALNTPINSSLSVTLAQTSLRTITTAAVSPSFTSHRLWVNGIEQPTENNNRLRACLDGVLALATPITVTPPAPLAPYTIHPSDWPHLHIHISSYNTFPTAAGLASSASGYAALVSSLAALCNASESYPGELSTIARRGSGSACRSLYGGFVAWRKGESDDGRDSIAEVVADETHWPEMRAVIVVASDEKKDTSSTSGMMTSVETSELLKYRAETIVERRMREMEEAVGMRDFERFGTLTMMDSNQFHATCLDTYPPIFYMNEVSRSVIRLIHAYNEYKGSVRAAYTFDAGPNAVIYTLEKDALEVCALVMRFYPPAGKEGMDGYLVEEEGMKAMVKEFVLEEGLVEAVRRRVGRENNQGDAKMVYFTRSGPGPSVLGKEAALIDETSGLNIYKP